MRSDLLDDVKEFLSRKGYDFFEYIRGCFDIAAKRERLLLLKVLTNVDSFQPYQARDLKVLSSSLSASPAIIGEKTRRENLKEDVIYERFGLPTLHIKTFKHALEGEYPRKVRSRGGTFGRMESENLRNAREDKELTQKELANRLDVSQKNISEHEKKSKRASYGVIRVAEELLDREIKTCINPFEMSPGKPVTVEAEENLRELGRYIERFGFDINYTTRAPPEIIARGEETLLSRLVAEERLADRWGECLVKFSRLSGSTAFLITEKNIGYDGIPSLMKEEINDMENSRELIKTVEERTD